MKEFALLIKLLGISTKTTDKLDALQKYFSNAADQDKLNVIALFSGRRPRRIATSTQLKNWCMEIANIPAWLLEESYHTVGDLAETISLLIPAETSRSNEQESLSWYLRGLIENEKASEAIKKDFVLQAWKKLDQNEIFVFNKLITGSFRIGVSQQTIVNALAKTLNIPSSVISYQISGNWDPFKISFNELLHHSGSDISKPYPFYLAYAIEESPENLGNTNDWFAEWKWDGIRGQIIKRDNELFVWSRGEELITDKFPEYQQLKKSLPNGTVLDGEILAYADNKPLPFSILQTRTTRKNVTKKQLQEAPVIFLTYDLLEKKSIDIRDQPIIERRKSLEQIVEEINDPILKISTLISFDNWNALVDIRRSARDVGSEGLMLKRKSSPYLVGRKKGDWWKWKIDPLTIDAVLIYAQKGHGRRSNLYTDYTFAVKDGDQLVTFAKAYSGLTDKEMAEVDSFVKRNSLEKFGPVRTVKPELVFEIAFEGIAKSNRHKSGVALRFPRINRWRKDKPVDEINTLDDLQTILKNYS